MMHLLLIKMAYLHGVSLVVFVIGKKTRNIPQRRVRKYGGRKEENIKSVKRKCKKKNEKGKKKRKNGVEERTQRENSTKKNRPDKTNKKVERNRIQKKKTVTKTKQHRQEKKKHATKGSCHHTCHHHSNEAEQSIYITLIKLLGGELSCDSRSL